MFRHRLKFDQRCWGCLFLLGFEGRDSFFQFSISYDEMSSQVAANILVISALVFSASNSASSTERPLGVAFLAPER
jgi:hypothetical protein